MQIMYFDFDNSLYLSDSFVLSRTITLETAIGILISSIWARESLSISSSSSSLNSTIAGSVVSISKAAIPL